MEDMQWILESSISGFHQYALSNPFHLVFVSKNLCDMLGISKEALLNDEEDLYAKRIHADDQKDYIEFLTVLSQKEQQRTLIYRITKADGSIAYVSDTMTSKRFSDGTIAGYSVLNDISEVKNENNNLQFLNATIPCGFIKYTCENRPRVTYINDQMLEMLRFPKEDGEGDYVDYLELYRQNIYLLIPREERRRFALFLERAYTQGTPIAGEMKILRCDGTKGYLFGWVVKTLNEEGVEEFQSVCMDISERYHARKDKEAKRYMQALSEVYDKIFEFDLLNHTVRYLYGNKSPMFRWLGDVPMQTTEALENWVENTVHEEDRENVREFFNEYSRKNILTPEARPSKIHFRAMSSANEMISYTGIFLKMDNSVSLFCCKNSAEADELKSLRYEAEGLKSINENMRELIMHFTEGIASFEVTGDWVKTLYISDNICDFFGFTKEQWLTLIKEGASIEKFALRSGSSYESYIRLLEMGEGEFTYFDLEQNIERRVKAICSPRDENEDSPVYVMLYNIDNNIDSAEEPEGKPSRNHHIVSIRTFGYFDVFVDGNPIAFRTQKAKELFALLVDRRGGFISSDEAIGFLWEDETVNTVTLARYRKVALRLKNILEEYDISDIIESVDGKRRLITSKVKCDLYDYLSGKDEFSQLFKGNYLTNYSWGETTLGALMNQTASD